MKSSLLVLAASLIAFSPSSVLAQTVDISTLKCSDIEAMGTEEVGVVLAWIDGYLGGKADDTRFDIDRFSENADEAAKACEEDPNAGLLTVIKAAEND